MRIQKVNPKNIRLPTWDVRYLRDIKWMEALIDNIDIHGITNPVLVYESEDFTKSGKYELIDGRTRTNIAKAMELPTIPAYIIDKPEEDPYDIALRLNQWQQNLDPVSLAMAIDRYHKAHGKNIFTTTQRFGFSSAHTWRYLNLWLEPDDVKLEIAQGRRPAFSHTPIQKKVKHRATATTETKRPGIRCLICHQWPKNGTRKWFVLCHDHTEEINAINKLAKQTTLKQSHKT